MAQVCLDLQRRRLVLLMERDQLLQHVVALLRCRVPEDVAAGDHEWTFDRVVNPTDPLQVRYENTFLGAVIEIDGNNPLDPNGTPISTKVGKVDETLIYTEDAAGKYVATRLIEEHERTDYTDYPLPTVGQSPPVIESIAGPLKLHVVQVDAPVSLAEHISKIIVGENATPRDLVLYQDNLYVATPDEIFATDRPSTFLLNYSLTFDPSKVPENVIIPDKVGTFLDGMSEGLLQPFVEMKETAVGIADAAGNAVKWLIDNPRYLDLNYAATQVAIKVGVTVHDNWDQIVAVAKRAVDIIDQTKAVAEEILSDLIQYPEETIEELIAGTHSALYNLPPEVRQAFEIGAELIGELVKELTNLSDYKKGYYLGYAVTTIAIEIATALATAGAGNALTMASKTAILAKIAPKFAKLGGRFQATLDNLGFNDLGNVIPNPQTPKLIHGLAATKMCFVAGTLVHTAGGLVPIESIRAGDLVLSRDERTGEQTYKPAIDTVTTRPDALYTVTYDRDGAGPLPAAEVVTTAPVLRVKPRRRRRRDDGRFRGSRRPAAGGRPVAGRRLGSPSRAVGRRARRPGGRVHHLQLRSRRLPYLLRQCRRGVGPQRGGGVVRASLLGLQPLPRTRQAGIGGHSFPSGLRPEPKGCGQAHQQAVLAIARCRSRQDRAGGEPVSRRHASLDQHQEAGQPPEHGRALRGTRPEGSTMGQ